MYGNRKEICHQLNKLFIGDEPLAVLFWTEASIAEACERFDPTDAEVIAVLEAIGTIPYEDYQAEGIEPSRFQELLLAHRETRMKKVAVPEVLLRVLINHASRDLNFHAELARMDGLEPPFSLIRKQYEVEDVKSLANLEDETDLEG